MKPNTLNQSFFHPLDEVHIGSGALLLALACRRHGKRFSYSVGVASPPGGTDVNY